MEKLRSAATSSAVLLAVAIVTAACGSNAVSPGDSEEPGAPSESSGGEPGSGGTLSVGTESDIFSLDPSQGYDVISWPAERLMFETLLGYDEGTELVPQLAEEMPEVSDDGLTYTFTLRDDVSFINGDGSVHREMTAEDVAYSINRILNPNLTPTPSPVAGAFFWIIEGGQEVIDGEADEATGIEVVDERTISFTLVQPDPTFLNVLAMPFGSVVPADLADDDTAAFSEAPVGTGPYYLESWTVGEQAVFVRHESYWGTPAPTDRVEFRFGIDGNTAAQQVEANQLDIMADPVPSGVVNSLRESYPDRIITVGQVAVSYLAMDTSPPDGGPLGVLEVRQAMNHAIDKENILQLLRGRGEVAHCIYPTLLPGHDPDCMPYDHDPERARELLEEAGFGDGFSTTLYTDTAEDSTAIAQAIQQDLAEIGIEVEIITQDFDTLLGTISTPHEAPLVYIGWFQDFPDPSDFYDPILSCAAAVEGGANSSWWCDEEVDAFAAEAKVEADPERRLEMYQDLQERVMGQAPWVPLVYPAQDTFISERVVGFKAHPVWFIDLAKYAVSD